MLLAHFVARREPPRRQRRGRQRTGRRGRSSSRLHRRATRRQHELQRVSHRRRLEPRPEERSRRRGEYFLDDRILHGGDGGPRRERGANLRELLLGQEHRPRHDAVVAAADRAQSRRPQLGLRRRGLERLAFDDRPQEPGQRRAALDVAVLAHLGARLLGVARAPRIVDGLRLGVNRRAVRRLQPGQVVGDLTHLAAQLGAPLRRCVLRETVHLLANGVQRLPLLRHGPQNLL